MKLCAPPGRTIAIEMQQHTGIGLRRRRGRTAAADDDDDEAKVL
jgi:hypothetical protein